MTAASGTPTFWRQALLGATARPSPRLPLEQVTLGGEPVDQSILDRLTDLFPAARDLLDLRLQRGRREHRRPRRPGRLPGVLARPRPRRTGRGCPWQDGELLIASDRSAATVSPGALRTGDRAEVVGDRVLITGRIASDEINVGGSKASAAAVRRVLLASPPRRLGAGPRRARRRSSARIVAADVVLDAPVATRRARPAGAPSRLPDYAVPRRIRLLDEIPIKETLKSDV